MRTRRRERPDRRHGPLFRGATALALSAAALTACSPHAGNTNSSAAASSANATPTAKAGYWRDTSTFNGAPPTTRESCTTGELTLSIVLDFCKASPTLTRTANGGVAIDLRCPAQNGLDASSVHADVSGDLNAHYVVDTKASVGSLTGTPPMLLTRHDDYQYIGPCPPTSSHP